MSHYAGIPSTEEIGVPVQPVRERRGLDNWTKTKEREREKERKRKKKKEKQRKTKSTYLVEPIHDIFEERSKVVVNGLQQVGAAARNVNWEYSTAHKICFDERRHLAR